MVFWLVLGLMTAAAIAVVVRPLLRRAPSPAADADGDLAVYRDQLAEIERDLSRGVLAPPEAEAARIEISRRLLAAAERADAARQTGAAAAPHSWRAVSIAALHWSSGASCGKTWLALHRTCARGLRLC